MKLQWRKEPNVDYSSFYIGEWNHQTAERQIRVWELPTRDACTFYRPIENFCGLCVLSIVKPANVERETYKRQYLHYIPIEMQVAIFLFCEQAMVINDVRPTEWVFRNIRVRTLSRSMICGLRTTLGDDATPISPPTAAFALYAALLFHSLFAFTSNSHIYILAS